MACGSDEEETAKLKVVTTVAPITSIVENIGGDRIQLEGVVPEGVNSHIFEPQPSLARLMTEADLIIANGLFLEEPTIQLAEANKKDDTPILLAGRSGHQPGAVAVRLQLPRVGRASQSAPVARPNPGPEVR